MVYSVANANQIIGKLLNLNTALRSSDGRIVDGHQYSLASLDAMDTRSALSPPTVSTQRQSNSRGKRTFFPWMVRPSALMNMYFTPAAYSPLELEHKQRNQEIDAP